jgi:hypothetical protein
VTYSADRNFLGSSASHAIKVRCRIVCDNPHDTPSRRRQAHMNAPAARSPATLCVIARPEVQINT